MHKYRVVGTVLDSNWGDDKFEVYVFANTPWEAMDKAADIMNKEVGKGNIDDLNAKDLGPEFVFFEVGNDSIEPQSRHTMTVGELIRFLEDYDSDSPINLVSSSGPGGIFKNYGTLNDYNIKAQSDAEEDDYY